MAKEGSVAPKERVNIVYRPATGDAKEEVELPLKLLVVGDYTLTPDDTPVEELKAKNTRLPTGVKSPLSDDPEAQMNLDLDFKSMKDFDPDAIIEKVPELKKLLDLREALKALKGPLGNVPEFRKRIQEMVQDEGTRERLLKELGIEE